MSKPEKPSEVTESGDPIYRHSQPADRQIPRGRPSTEKISEHIEKYLGKVDSIFHEFLSDTVHIDVFRVNPRAEFPFFSLITSGMSDLPMSVPPEVDAPRYLELMITLPGDWKFDDKSLRDESWYWPVRLIKMLALLPHKHGTWLGWGHSIPNGDPPLPYAENTKLCCALIWPPVTSADGFRTLTISREKEIHFFAIVPLYKEEMDLKLRSGMNVLLNKLGQANVNDIVDLSRPNVARKRFGLF